MLSTSSPTISAPASPSATFHARRSSYHASRRTSASSSASPRFLPQVSASSSRRPDKPHAAHTAPAQSPSALFARSPQLKRKEYSDAGTQYSPDGYPPTYHPPPHPPALAPSSLTSTPAVSSTIAFAQAKPPSPAQIARLPPGSSRTSPKRRETSAEAAVTAPLEPELRVDPQSTELLRNAQQPEQGAGGGEPMTAQQGGTSEASTAAQNQPSSAKRARPQDPNVKVMPLRYETCDVKDLGVLISDMLMELVRLNDGIPLRDGQLTRFHSRAPPGISVRDYLNRLIVHATLSPPILLSMVFYVDKLCALYPAFTISSLTVHRFLITSATVAAKGLSDSFWTNSLYARVGGVSVRELALLELEFLRRLEWRIVPKPETLVDYYKGLVERGTGYVMEKEPIDAPAGAPAPTPVLSPSGSRQSQQADGSPMDVAEPGPAAPH